MGPALPAFHFPFREPRGEKKNDGARCLHLERRDKISDKISYLISSYLIERREEEEVVVVVVVFTKFLTRNISTNGLQAMGRS
jgi:hypothetical protein